MPWTCPACHVAVALDTAACPTCGVKKAHRTVVDGKLVLALETKKFVLLRGEGTEPLPAGDPAATPDAVAQVEADEVVALPLATAAALAAKGKVPAPRHQLIVRASPRAEPTPTATVSVVLSGKKPAEHAFPVEKPTLTEGRFDQAFVFVFGAGALPTFPGLHVVDVTDAGAPAGHSKNVLVSGLKKKAPKTLTVFAVAELVDLELRDAHDEPKALPATVTVGTRLYAKCRVTPRVDGTFKWSSPDAHVRVENVDQELAQFQPRRAGKVTLRCELVGTSTHVVEHALEVVKKKAKLVFPTASPHTQYVNLDSDAGHPERGSTVQVKTQLEGGKKGDAVFLRLERKTGNSKRNRPQPQVAEGVTEDWCKESGRVVPMRGDAGSKDCEALFDVELGYAGGDHFTIHVGGDEACDDAKVEVVNWRRLDLALMVPPGISPTLTKTTDAMKALFIELALASTVPVTSADGKPGVRSWDTPGTHLDIGLHNYPWFQDKLRLAAPAAPGIPRVFVIAAHTTYTPVDARIDATLSPTAALSGFTAAATLALTLPGKDTFVAAPTLDTNGSPLVRGDWREADAAGTPVPGGATGALAAADLTVPTDFGRSVRVTLPAPAARVLGPGKTVVVRVEVTVCMGVGGFTSPGTDKVGASYSNDSNFNHVLTHELGHILRQSAVNDKAPGLEGLAHGFTYENKGHTGPHCDFGLSATARARHDYWVSYPTLGSQAKCVMFGDDSPEKAGAPGRFCSHCEPFARASHVKNLASAMGS